jgi:hypothetical protein
MARNVSKPGSMGKAPAPGATGEPVSGVSLRHDDDSGGYGIDGGPKIKAKRSGALISPQSTFAREFIGDVIQSALKPRGNLLDFGSFDDERRCEHQAVADHAQD